MNTKYALSVFLLSFLVASIVPAVADEDDAADREDIVKSLQFNDWQDFIKKGKVELVLRPSYEFFSDGGEDEQEAEVALELETFPGENWEMELELEGFTYVDEEGEDSEEDIGNIELDLEYRVLHSFDPVVDLRVGVAVEQPLSSASDGVTDGLRKYEPHVSARWKINDFHMFSRIGYAFVDRDTEGGEEERFLKFFGRDDEDEEEEDILEYQLAGFYPMNRWRFGFELFGESNELDDGDETELFLSPEVRWRQDDIEFGLGFPIGLTDDSPDYGLFFQVYLGFDLREGKASDREHHVFWRG